jgi:hypothetical protein
VTLLLRRPKQSRSERSNIFIVVKQDLACWRKFSNFVPVRPSKKSVWPTPYPLIRDANREHRDS